MKYIFEDEAYSEADGLNHVISCFEEGLTALEHLSKMVPNGIAYAELFAMGERLEERLKLIHPQIVEEEEVMSSVGK